MSPIHNVNKFCLFIGSVKIEIKQVNAKDLTDEILEEDVEQHKEENWKSGTLREPFKPLMDPEIVKEFLRGEN